MKDTNSLNRDKKRKLVNQKLIDEAFYKGRGEYERMYERLMREISRLQKDYPDRDKVRRVEVVKSGEENVSYVVQVTDVWNTKDGIIIKGRL